jgi:ABC-2 type transport system permease protein
VFSATPLVGTYQEHEIITYIATIHILGAFVLSTRIEELSSQINSGELSNALVKPISIFSKLLASEAADKLMNIIFVPLELLAAFTLVGIPLTLSLQLSWVGIAAALIGMVLYFLIGFLISTLGFWTTETWAVRFFFFIIVEFCAGTIIPLDLYPQWLQSLLFSLPFPFILYTPVREFLGKDILAGHILITPIIWTIVCAVAVYTVWKMGLRRYEAQGR